MGPGPKVESPKQRRKQPRGDNLTGESGVILRLMWILRCEYWSFSLQLHPPKPWRTGIWSAIRKIETSTKKAGLAFAKRMLPRRRREGERAIERHGDGSKFKTPTPQTSDKISKMIGSTLLLCWYLHLQHLCSHQLSQNSMWTMGVSTSSKPIRWIHA